MSNMAHPKRHRHAREFILRFARKLVSGYYSIIKIYMADAGSKIIVFLKVKTARFFDLSRIMVLAHAIPQISADDNGGYSINGSPYKKTIGAFFSQNIYDTFSRNQCKKDSAVNSVYDEGITPEIHVFSSVMFWPRRR